MVSRLQIAAMRQHVQLKIQEYENKIRQYARDYTSMYEAGGRRLYAAPSELRGALLSKLGPNTILFTGSIDRPVSISEHPWYVQADYLPLLPGLLAQIHKETTPIDDRVRRALERLREAEEEHG